MILANNKMEKQLCGYVNPKFRKQISWANPESVKSRKMGEGHKYTMFSIKNELQLQMQKMF